MRQVIRHATLKRVGCAVAVSGMVMFGLAAGTTAANATTKAHASSTPTVTWADLPQASPNYIFPFMGLEFFNVYNSQDFQYLMYRPLYWFGQGSSPVFNGSLSLADNPSYSKNSTVVTLKLKNYKWSNGEKVTADDVVFWLNLLKANKAGWAGYVPGTIPDNIKNVTTSGSNKVVITLTGSVNSHWFTYDNLSEITPFPAAWDVTSLTAKAGSGGCSTAAYSSITIDAKGGPVSTAAKDCVAVYNFLSEQSGFDPTKSGSAATLPNAGATWSSSKVWQVVDGPYHLASFNATGDVILKPNSTYSGPVKPKVNVDEKYFTSSDAEFNALLSGSVGVGYVNSTQITASSPGVGKVGANNSRIASDYKLYPEYSWGFDYADLNFNSTGSGGTAGAILRQLPVRQALQTLVDQPLYLDKIYKNYGVPTYGPVPVYPKNPFSTKFEQSNPYPYSVKSAEKYLKNAGWTIVPNGTDVCGAAKGCGTGVPKGTKLSLTMQYATGKDDFTAQVTDEKEAWLAAGINVKLNPASFDVVAGNATACKPGPSCSWEIQNFGGWVYSPDYYPTGEDLFETGSIANAGSYSDAKADKLIKETDFTNSDSAFSDYENYLAKQIPVLYQPNSTYNLIEVKNTVSGVAPVNPLLIANPEAWRVKNS